MKEKTKSALTGALAGIANGFFGAGGGMILVPLFDCWVGLEQRECFATSLAVVFPMCVVSAVIYAVNDGVELMAVLPYLLGGLIGGFVGGRVFKKIPAKWLHRLMGGLIIYGGIKNIF